MTGGVPTDSAPMRWRTSCSSCMSGPTSIGERTSCLSRWTILNFRLTGRAVASYATVFPYLLTDNRDNTRVDYDARLIAWCGLDRAKLPDLLPVGTLLGTIRPEAAAEWGLSPETQIVGGTPDSQAAAHWLRRGGRFQGHVCVGTTAWLSCHVPFKKTNLFQYLATMPSAIHGRNMVTAEQGASGKCLAVFVDNGFARPTS